MESQPHYRLRMLNLPREVAAFAHIFRDAGYELYLVGGAVRDSIMGIKGADYDFASSATPEETSALFTRVIPTGIRHGTVTVPFQGRLFEVTTYRIDGDYGDSRHPDAVSYTRSLTEDLARRDFTINAIAYDPISRRLIDPHGGRADITARVIKTVGSAEDRFGEDALRMLRAVRFAAQLEFALDEEAYEAIGSRAPTILRIAVERISAELRKMMSALRPSLGWTIMHDTTLLTHIIPELTEDRSIPVKVFPHLLMSCDCAPPSHEVLRWAALLHDVAKPRCYAEDERGVSFIGHDALSAEIATEILTRLRFPGKTVEAIAHLVRHHMYGYTSEWSDAAIRRFISRVGSDSVYDLTALSRADACGKGGVPHDLPLVRELERRVEAILESAPPLEKRDLAVGGHDLMSELGIRPGPTIGHIIDELYDSVLGDPGLNTRERLLEIARRFVAERLDLDS